MRISLLFAASLLAVQAQAEEVVVSPAPDHLALTVYRDPNRGAQPFSLQWLNGYALVSETRHVHLPAGESEVRFEGVTEGLVPQTAIVSGLGTAVLEKNRDARLLSPGGLIDASLGQRLILRRTDRATGKVMLQDAILRATSDGVVIQTQEGIEALRCTGLSETVLARSIPVGLSATPTLSVRIRSPAAADREITLSYITNNFDWQADYVGTLSSDGHRMRLFGWVTLANGDATGLANAAAQAVAGQLNRERTWVDQGQATPISIRCWPSARTDQIPGSAMDDVAIVITGSRLPRNLPAVPAPPPPPPPPALEAAKVMAREERLGDVRLYRIPIAVTVAPRSQKQIAMLDRPNVQVEQVLRLRPSIAAFDAPFERVLRTRNTLSNGLGLALPAGRLELFQVENGHRLLVGEGQIEDRTVGEKVEFVVGEALGVRAHQRLVSNKELVLAVSNADPTPRAIEVELPLNARALAGGKLVSRNGWKLWQTVVPRNGTRQLRYRI